MSNFPFTTFVMYSVWSSVRQRLRCSVHLYLEMCSSHSTLDLQWCFNDPEGSVQEISIRRKEKLAYSSRLARQGENGVGCEV